MIEATLLAPRLRSMDTGSMRLYVTGWVTWTRSAFLRTATGN